MMRGLGALLCLSAVGSTCLAGQSFRFVVVAPTPVEVFSASEAGFQVYVDLVSQNSDPQAREGATGWSFSLVVRGAEVTRLSLLGLEVSTVFDQDGDPATPSIDPFRVTIADAPLSILQSGSGDYPGSPIPGENGVVSAVSLHLNRQIALHANDRATIAVLQFRKAPLIDGCSPVEIELIDGLAAGGVPVLNLVDYAGGSVRPELGRATVEVCNYRRPDFDYYVVPEGIATAETPEGGLVVRPEVVIREGENTSFEFDAFVVIKSNTYSSEGLQGWSVAAGNEPGALPPQPPRGGDCLDVLTATINGVVVDTLFDHDNEPSTPLVDLPLDLSQASYRIGKPVEGGAASAIVLHFTQKRILRPVSSEKVLKIRYRYLPAIREGDSNQACTIDFPERLKTGGFFHNVVTFRGRSFTPTLHKLTVKPVGIPPRLAGFIRGNANDDGRVDIADPIRVVRAVVPSLGGPPLPCPAAGDSNADGGLDLVDVIHLISYLFRSGPAPPAPYPGCGLPGGGSPVDCPDGSDACIHR